MTAPPTAQESASQTRTPLFNGKYYGWWKNRMMDHLIGENPDLWRVIQNNAKAKKILKIDHYKGPGPWMFEATVQLARVCTALSVCVTNLQEYLKTRGDKEKNRDQLPENSRKKAANMYAVKQVLAAWGDSSSDSGEDKKTGDISMLAVEDILVIYDFLFAFMKDEFLALEQGEMSVSAYEAKFHALSYYATQLLTFEEESICLYIKG
ncbi:hypothetical protein FXO38_21059 [Capsicum annuum]|nr:hypothetical protein FXO38_21059 [Capsicum annuum]